MSINKVRIKYEYPNGNIFEGEVENAVIPDGKGKFIFAHKDIYEGEFRNGKRNGKGKYTFANGNIYEGEFVNDLYNGKGKYLDNGVIYDGNFIEGIKNGRFLVYPESEPDNKKEVLYNCGYPVKLSDYQRKTADKEYSGYPIISGKDVGNCLSLTGHVTVIAVYANDGKSSWNTKDKEASRHIVYDSLKYLEISAKEYGTELNFSIVEKEDKYRNTINWPPSQEFYEEYYSKINSYNGISASIMESEGTSQTAIMLLFNKDFTSFSYMKDIANDCFEIAFIGARSELKNQIAHELLHLFGAQDLYRTEEMKKFTVEYYPISIMYKTSDVFLPVDEVTAYLIGWVAGLSERAADFIKKTKNIKIRPETEG